ncbi:MAG: type II secretion system protein [Phycisphaerae bacterium]
MVVDRGSACLKSARGGALGGARCGSRRWRAFTLIELLVVMAIITLLTGIVVPSVSRARHIGRRTTCAVRLREVALAASMYLQAEHAFPALNNDPEDGHWQYNYVIFDGRDFRENFGPLVVGNLVPEMRILYCPLQTSPAHLLASGQNPWPTRDGVDTRAGYGRRHLIGGLDATQLPPSTAVFADLFHTPQYVRETGHTDGINAAFIDGHVRWMPNFDRLVNNTMVLPTSLIDNPTMDDIWKGLDLRD